MINPKDKVKIFRNGHLTEVGVARTIRGMNQQTITIELSDSYKTFEVYRHNGLATSDMNDWDSGVWTAKVVTEPEFLDGIKKLDAEFYLRRLKDTEERLEKERQLDILRDKSLKWFETLTQDEKDMVNALVWHWRPIAVA